jgi:hypothetical protein
LVVFSTTFFYTNTFHGAVLQPPWARPWVWPLPFSLATTCGITTCFLFLRLLRCFSSAGLRLYHAVFNCIGCPIRTPADQRSFAPPRSFSQLTTSFVASGSQGIPHTPLFRFHLLILDLISIPTQASLSKILLYTLDSLNVSLLLLLTAFLATVAFSASLRPTPPSLVNELFADVPLIVTP